MKFTVTPLGGGRGGTARLVDSIVRYLQPPSKTPGRDAVSGLANLLKRSVPQREILSVCLAEWRQAFGRSPRNAERLNAAETLAARTPQSLNAGMETVEAYKAIAAILSQRGRQT